MNMNMNRGARDESVADDAPAEIVNGDATRPEPPTWQLYVPLFVTLFAIGAIVMFVYGFCTTNAR